MRQLNYLQAAALLCQIGFGVRPNGEVSRSKTDVRSVDP
ncbi:hypothetical protein DGo_PC0090 (plasmid) [Deinococcus gobiensis I-0]|uniref:Uncharacterized protein n=1 Tax=Deinococcus gobiensis (strain DSM 21396 / JCM 16679 / CGMCC 1.7299 / I-0) TaxID=745776 RepID=H8H2Y5_DEIGI|nr:hypothetical protein DGo_PC0090 [Deinococcus gobiensis I-0]